MPLFRSDTQLGVLTELFCGRDEETCDLLQRLRDQRRAGCAFAVIVGASGSGKSSLARAGVAATLLQHASDDGVKEWRTAFVLPAAVMYDTNPTELVSVETGLCTTSETSVVQKPGTTEASSEESMSPRSPVSSLNHCRMRLNSLCVARRW